MYIPKFNRVEDDAKALSFVKGNPFAIVISNAVKCDEQYYDRVCSFATRVQLASSGCDEANQKNLA